MRRYLILVFLIAGALLLASCAATRYPSLHTDLTQENWMRFISTQPDAWAQGADRWFFTGDPNAAEMADRQAPYPAAISTMMVRVPGFTDIRVNGNFQVQLFGTYGNNSVYVYGPHDSVRAVLINTQGNTLCITQTKDAPPNMHNVIIRIGINQFHRLIQQGCGSIEGVRLHSYDLSIVSAGPGNIYLGGDLNLRQVTAVSSGSVSVFGANTPCLDITTQGGGCVNVSGHIGLRSIIHHGRNNINVIGASGGALKVYADGAGKVGVSGNVNVCEIQARNNVCVYICTVSGRSVYAYLTDNARVGLAGGATNLYVDASDNSNFAGRYLCVSNAYVRAHNNAHINVSANNRAFASATQNSSIYFFGSPVLMSQFISGNGVVMPVWSRTGGSCMISTHPYPAYKGQG